MLKQYHRSVLKDFLFIGLPLAIFAIGMVWLIQELAG